MKIKEPELITLVAAVVVSFVLITVLQMCGCGQDTQPGDCEIAERLHNEAFLAVGKKYPLCRHVYCWFHDFSDATENPDNGFCKKANTFNMTPFLDACSFGYNDYGWLERCVADQQECYNDLYDLMALRCDVETR